VYLLEPKDAKDYFGKEQQDSNAAVRLIASDESAVLKDVVAWLRDNPHFERVTEPGQSRLLIGDDGRRLRVLRNSGDEVFYRDAGYTADWAEARIKDWGKWYNILAIENHQSKSIQVEVDVRSLDRPGQELVTTAAADVMRSFRHEEKVEISVLNKGDTDVFFVLLDISSDGTVRVINRTDNDRKLKGRESKLMRTQVGLPCDYSRLTDCLKMIATAKARDFSFIEIEGSQTKGSDPLTRLLEEAAGQTKSRGSRNAGFEDWATAEVTSEIVRAP